MQTPDPESALRTVISCGLRHFDLVSFATKRHGFGDDNGGFGVTYPEDLDDYNRQAEGAFIPPGHVEAYGFWGPPDGWEVQVPEAFYLETLATVFRETGQDQQAEKVRSLLNAKSAESRSEATLLFDFFDRRCAEAMQAALVTDAFYAFLERRAQGPFHQRREAMVRYMDFSLTEAEQFEWGICLRLDESRGLGASVWSKPKTPEAAEQAQADKCAFLASHLGDDCATAYREISRFMSQQSDAVVSPESWYLSILALAPDHQGQGLGSSLLTPVLERSDKLGVATYLETFTPRNESFYRRLGYRVMFRTHEPTIGADYALMQRPPEQP